jgi:hypothetical protein
MSEDDDNIDHIDAHDKMVLIDTDKTSGTSKKKTQVQMIDFFYFHLLFITLFLFCSPMAKNVHCHKNSVNYLLPQRVIKRSHHHPIRISRKIFKSMT